MSTRHFKGKYSWLKHLDFILLDLAALMIAFAIAYFFKFRNWDFLYNASWKEIIVICCLLDLVVILFTAPFSGILRRGTSEELLRTLTQSIYDFVLCCILLYVLRIGRNYSRTVILVMHGLYFVISLLLRTLWKELLRSRKGVGSSEKSIFVVGTRADMPQLLRSINSGFFREYAVKGICVTDGEPGERVTARIDDIDAWGRVQVRLLELENSATLESMADYILKNRIQEVFVGIKPSEISSEIYQTLINNGKSVHLSINPMVGFPTDNQFITTVGTYKALSLGEYSLTGEQLVYSAFKRAIDIVLGLLGAVLLLPLMAVVKLSFLLTGDKASIFYTQTRVGINGKPFQMVKFRSMVQNAGEVLQELLKNPAYAEEWAENQKLENDPRITKMGNLLRKTSLDEVPQFLNVLKGDMSVIGPRPLVPGELEAHGGLQLYNQVKPGITGWWGCNGRSNTTYDERLELEYYYVKNFSFYLDALCVVKTVVALVERDGAK